MNCLTKLHNNLPLPLIMVYILICIYYVGQYLQRFFLTLYFLLPYRIQLIFWVINRLFISIISILVNSNDTAELIILSNVFLFKVFGSSVPVQSFLLDWKPRRDRYNLDISGWSSGFFFTVSYTHVTSLLYLQVSEWLNKSLKQFCSILLNGGLRLCQSVTELTRIN